MEESLYKLRVDDVIRARSSGGLFLQEGEGARAIFLLYFTLGRSRKTFFPKSAKSENNAKEIRQINILRKYFIVLFVAVRKLKFVN